MTTAEEISKRLKISTRTVYRDIQELCASGIVVEGIAGVGYRLPEGMELPPMSLNPEEVRVLALGVRLVESWADPGLTQAAERLRVRLDAAAVRVGASFSSHARGSLERLVVPEAFVGLMRPLRVAMEESRKVRVGYVRADGLASRRTVCPLGLFYWGRSWSLLGWCELRGQFRSFRLDRIQHLQVSEDFFSEVQGRTLQDFLASCPPACESLVLSSPPAQALQPRFDGRDYPRPPVAEERFVPKMPASPPPNSILRSATPF